MKSSPKLNDVRFFRITNESGLFFSLAFYRKGSAAPTSVKLPSGSVVFQISDKIFRHPDGNFYSKLFVLPDGRAAARWMMMDNIYEGMESCEHEK